jgi:hypothetical protein
MWSHHASENLPNTIARRAAQNAAWNGSNRLPRREHIRCATTQQVSIAKQGSLAAARQTVLPRDCSKGMFVIGAIGKYGGWHGI